MTRFKLVFSEAVRSIQTNFSLEVSAHRMAEIYRAVLEGA